MCCSDACSDTQVRETLAAAVLADTTKQGECAKGDPRQSAGDTAGPRRRAVGLASRSAARAPRGRGRAATHFSPAQDRLLICYSLLIYDCATCRGLMRALLLRLEPNGAE